MKQLQVFLGGTCGTSTWREELIPRLNIDYYNPQVDPGMWNDAMASEELVARATSEICVYVITKEMEGFYSVAEVIDDSNKRSRRTVFCFIEDGFTEIQLKSLRKVGEMVESNGGLWLESLDQVVEYINLHNVNLRDDVYGECCENAKESAITRGVQSTDEDVINAAINTRVSRYRYELKAE